eukprot:TRINITY_DN11486_c0_g1_i1.p1 TRINITY_DN11486_c0_g1~~TRINITY_DN11486_c0_g1_i1.p1  ORF type:complete len:382 (+),score=151.89 TRINITY_DN11486_c0_g1_i1:74-1147(+)
MPGVKRKAAAAAPAAKKPAAPPKKTQGDAAKAADVPKKAQAGPVDSGSLSAEAAALRAVLAPVAAGLPAGAAAQQAALQKVAGELLLGWEMLIAGEVYRILELECYVHSDTHVDPYTHSDPDQEHCGVWYFHKRGGTFKAGSFKGMDLACGGKAPAGAGKEAVHAGLLIRSIEDATTGHIVEGPCLVVDHILKKNLAPSIQGLVKGRGAADLPAAATPELRLRRAAKRLERRLWRAPRVGLVLKKEDPESKVQKAHSSGRPDHFCTRPYRFATDPFKLKKLRCLFAAQAELDGDAAVLPELKLPAKGLAEYVAATQRGAKEGKPERFVDKKLATQPELCELVGACHPTLGSLYDGAA